jgi:hypothetical protein
MLEADGSKLFPLDLLAVAALNRSLSNSSAFTQLVRSENYLTAASLVRRQLDTFLRFFAAYQVSDPHEFAISVLAGTEVRKLKDRSGSFMTDRHLVESVAPEFPWVPSVYKATSGFIHLSDKHIYSTIQSAAADGAFLIFPRNRGHAAKQHCSSPRTRPANGSRAWSDDVAGYRTPRSIRKCPGVPHRA